MFRTGEYCMNPKLSDSQNDLLQAQGVSWIMRKAITSTLLSIKFDFFTNDSGKQNIKISGAVRGGFLAPVANIYTLDGQMLPRQDPVFGAIKVSTSMLSVEQLRDINGLLADGWLEDTEKSSTGNVTPGLFCTNTVPDAQKGNKLVWESREAWGFTETDTGDKKEWKLVRKVHFESKDLKQDLTVIYDIIDADT